jgi:hypothetical protein
MAGREQQHGADGLRKHSRPWEGSLSALSQLSCLCVDVLPGLPAGQAWVQLISQIQTTGDGLIIRRQSCCRPCIWAHPSPAAAIMHLLDCTTRSGIDAAPSRDTGTFNTGRQRTGCACCAAATQGGFLHCMRLLTAVHAGWRVQAEAAAAKEVRRGLEQQLQQLQQRRDELAAAATTVKRVQNEVPSPCCCWTTCMPDRLLRIHASFR